MTRTKTPTKASLSARNLGHLRRMAVSINGEVHVAETVMRVLTRLGLATCRGYDAGFICKITDLGREIAG